MELIHVRTSLWGKLFAQLNSTTLTPGTLAAVGVAAIGLGPAASVIAGSVTAIAIAALSISFDQRAAVARLTGGGSSTVAYLSQLTRLARV